MKNLLGLPGAQRMNKSSQQSINGGYNYIACTTAFNCPPNWFCNGEHCVPCRYATGPVIGCD